MKAFIILFTTAYLVAVTCVNGQFSMGLNTGYIISNSLPDPYAPEKDWQNSSNSSELGFYDGATGMAINIFLAWEASKRVSLGVVYRQMRFSNATYKRTTTDSNLGVLFKVNFTSHEKKFVPFGQLNFVFSGNHKLDQKQLTDSRNQVQPAFSESVRIKFGAGIDLGLEVRLSGGLYAMASGGLHAIDLDEKYGEQIKSLYISQVPNNTPDKIIGPLFIQFSGGLKYYLSKRKKKRDF